MRWQNDPSEDSEELSPPDLGAETELRSFVSYCNLM
jgi:hypothetical protein